jgi:hypothetical protein
VTRIIVAAPGSALGRHPEDVGTGAATLAKLRKKAPEAGVLADCLMAGAPTFPLPGRLRFQRRTVAHGLHRAAVGGVLDRARAGRAGQQGQAERRGRVVPAAPHLEQRRLEQFGRLKQFGVLRLRLRLRLLGRLRQLRELRELQQRRWRRGLVIQRGEVSVCHA